jgi:ankyrin repeat protein/thiol-disulfide isomerase/thioredoxin
MTLKTLSLFLLLSSVSVVISQENKPAQPKPATPKLNFDKTGPQVGEQVPDLRLHTLKGEEQRLSDAWNGGPALLVTSSLTCPKSRSRWPELKELVEKYQDQLNVVIVYVIEAHPVGSVCPYKGVEDVTPENERDGILRKQPKTLEDRLELAQEFKRLLRINTPIYIDNIKDEAWKGLGAAPNLALLVDQKGIVVSRSGWFEGKKSKEAIDKYLQANKKTDDQDSRSEDAIRDYAEGVYAQLEKAGFKPPQFRWFGEENSEELSELGRMLKAVPAAANLVIGSQQGHPYYATLLMDAVKDRNAAAVKLFLEHGANVKASTETYDSALQIAAQVGDVAIAKMLLAKGADPNFPATGESPLHESAVQGHSELARLLIATGLRHDLYSAIALGEIEMVRQGLQADPSRAMRPDGASRMPLDYAAANGQLEIAKLLLAHGAPVVRDLRSSIETPLHRAIAHNDAAMTELLLAAGSSPDTSVGHGGEYSESKPAIHLAISQKNLAIVKILLAYKVNVNARDTYSQTALHDAAAAGQAEIVAALLQAGADVNVPQLGFSLPCGSGAERRPSNTTPLHFAASGGNVATIKVLLAAGAKVNAVTKHGATPLMFAASSRRYEKDKQESRLPIAELLIAQGADVKLLDSAARSVLDHATSAYHGEDARSLQDHQEMIALLQKHGAKAAARKTKGAALDDPFGK